MTVLTQKTTNFIRAPVRGSSDLIYNVKLIDTSLQ